MKYLMTAMCLLLVVFNITLMVQDPHPIVILAGGLTILFWLSVATLIVTKK